MVTAAVVKPWMCQWRCKEETTRRQWLHPGTHPMDWGSSWAEQLTQLDMFFPDFIIFCQELQQNLSHLEEKCLSLQNLFWCTSTKLRSGRQRKESSVLELTFAEKTFKVYYLVRNSTLQWWSFVTVWGFFDFFLPFYFFFNLSQELMCLELDTLLK